MLKVGNLYKIVCMCGGCHSLLANPKQDGEILLDPNIECLIESNSIVMYLGLMRHNFSTYYELLCLNQICYIPSCQFDKQIQLLEVK